MLNTKFIYTFADDIVSVNDMFFFHSLSRIFLFFARSADNSNSTTTLLMQLWFNFMQKNTTRIKENYFIHKTKNKNTKKNNQHNAQQGATSSDWDHLWMRWVGCIVQEILGNVSSILILYTYRAVRCTLFWKTFPFLDCLPFFIKLLIVYYFNR